MNIANQKKKLARAFVRLCRHTIGLLLLSTQRMVFVNNDRRTLFTTTDNACGLTTVALG